MAVSSRVGPSRISIDRRRFEESANGLFAACALEISRVLDRDKSGHRKVEAGCDLLRLGDRAEMIYTLLNGWVALYKLLEDGRRQILHFALPGAVLGFTPGPVMAFSAQALTPVTVSVIARHDLYSLLEDHPEIGIQLAWQVSCDRSIAYDHLSSIGRQSARERVAHLLLELFIRFRMQWPGHRIEEMQLPLTQEDIGDATGLTGVHVNRVLRDLRKEGIVEFHYKRLRILDPDRLIDVAKIDPHMALSWVAVSPLNKSVSNSERAGVARRHGYPTPILAASADSSNTLAR